MSKSIVFSLSVAALAGGAMLALELSPASAFTLHGTSVKAPLLQGSSIGLLSRLPRRLSPRLCIPRRLRLSRWLPLRPRLRPPSLRLRLSRRSAALCPWRRLRLSRWLRLRLRPPSLRLRLSRRSAALCPWRRLRLSRWPLRLWLRPPSLRLRPSRRSAALCPWRRLRPLPSLVEYRCATAVGAAVAAPHCWINSYANEPPDATAGSTSATRSAGGVT